MARHKPKKLEPIRYDELLNNSSMEGLVSFINYHPEARRQTGPSVSFSDISSSVVESSTVDDSTTVDIISAVDGSVLTLQNSEAHNTENFFPVGIPKDRVSEPSELDKTVKNVPRDLYAEPLELTVDSSSSVVNLSSVDETSVINRDRHPVFAYKAHSGVQYDPEQISEEISSTENKQSTVDELSSVDEIKVFELLPNEDKAQLSFSEERPKVPGAAHWKETRNVSSTVGVSSTVPSDKLLLLQQAVKEGKPPRSLAPTWQSVWSGQLYEAKKVQPVRIAQHSMTTGQERFYEAIWKAKSDARFRIETLSRDQKRFRSGYDILARITRMADRNVQKNVPQLIAKKILHSYGDFNSSTRQGTTYDVFSYDMILQRQRAAGLCFVVKVGPGVEFVVPHGWGDNVSTVDESSPDDNLSTVDTLSPVDIASTGTVDVTSASTVDQTSIPIDNRRETQIRQTSSPPKEIQAPPKWLWEGFRKLDPDLDDGAIHRIWRESRQLVVDITAEEVLELFEARARVVYRIRSLDNPRGVLIKSLQDWINPRKVEAHREQRRQELEEMERIRRELEQEY